MGINQSINMIKPIELQMIKQSTEYPKSESMIQGRLGLEHWSRPIFWISAYTDSNLILDFKILLYRLLIYIQILYCISRLC